MTFSKYLESQSVPEWRKAYINYTGLKAKLRQVEKFHRDREQQDWLILDQKLDSISVAKGETTYNNYGDRDNKSISSISSSSSSISSMSPRISSSRSSRIFLSRSASSNSVATLSIMDEVLFHVNEPERSFFIFLDDESEKISKFYKEKENEAKLKLDAIKLQLKVVTEYHRFLLNNASNCMNLRYSKPSWFNNYKDPHAQSYQLSEISSDFSYLCDQKTSYNVARSRLKKAVIEYYRSLELLKSYITVNKTGFQKLLYKFDKVAGWKASSIYLKDMKALHWFDSKNLKKMITETETIYVNEFSYGNRRNGIKALSGTLEKQKDYGKVTLRVGLFLGMAIPLLLQSFLLAIDPKTAKQLPNLQTNIQIYACFLLPLFFVLGFSINLIIWSKSKINYKFIFELDAKDHLDHHQFPELPVLMLFISSVIIYLDLAQVFQKLVPSEIYPLALFVIITSMLLCPFDLLYFSARKWLCTTLGRIFCSYFFPVEFRDFFIADELNSLSYSIWTFSYFFCAYSCNWVELEKKCSISQVGFSPLLAALPPWWRLLQCFRRYRDSGERVHLLNAAKYINGIMVVITACLKRVYPSITSIWVIIAICNSCYTCIWDIKMDWGLCQNNTENSFLRDEIVFYKWAYYAAMVLNILLRFSWIILTLDFKVNAQLIGIVLALLEIYRRIQWNFFRLENEHLNNCCQYRAIRDIPLPFQIHENYNDDRISNHSTTCNNLFYGVRDFENKQDNNEEDEEVKSKRLLVRRNSNIESILSHIQSMHEVEAM